MQAKDRPFVLYRGGRWGSWIVPRGPKGWTQFVIWLALLAPLVVWFAEHVLSHRASEDFGAAVILFVAGVALWLMGGYWWMLVRSELVMVVEIERQREYERRARERERRRTMTGEELKEERRRERRRRRD